MQDWMFSESDRQAAECLSAQLPPVLFDAHAHLYVRDKVGVPPNSVFATGPEQVTPAVWRRHLELQVGAGRCQGALFIPVPMPLAKAGSQECLQETLATNQWLLQCIADQPEMQALGLIAPGMERSHFAALLENKQFAGFKPYHTYSTTQPTFEAAIEDYLPELAWRLADEHGLIITLHVVRAGALADAGNAAYLRAHAKAYPNAKLILAHAGRSFHAPNARRGAAALGDLPNVWFDSSGICESEPLRALLEIFGPRRLLWGSDFPVSEQRSRCVTVGDGFCWLNMDATGTGGGVFGQAWPVGLENLRALLDAAAAVGLNHDDLQDICANNARRLLGLLPESMTRTQDLYRHAKERIPGGTQLLSKRPEMAAPDQWPPYFREARGCETWDLDGRRYIDMSTNGIGSCLLGFRDPDVTYAVKRRLNLGSMSTLNPPEEVELADRLCELHPWAQQVRLARCGGEACAMAVRIARATTDRSIVAICGYSGWQDWYLAANLGDSDSLRGHLLPGLAPLGVPRELRGTTVAFPYNDPEAFQALLDRHGNRLAAVIMEPCRSEDPAPGFLELVRDGLHRVGALLIFDEITIAFRLHHGGAHLRYGVEPDLAVFAKALGNGHPIAAVIGTRPAMLGARDSFISSTYWTESIGPVAALATLAKMDSLDVPAHVAHIGERVQQIWRTQAQRYQLPVRVGGYPCLANFRFEHAQADVLRTLFTQYMLDRGFLATGGFYPTLAHSDAVVDTYQDAVEATFGMIAELLSSGAALESQLRGPVAHSGFQRLIR